MRLACDKDCKISYRLKFPNGIKKKPIDKNTILLGLGGNIGNVYFVFKKALDKLSRHSQVKIISTSVIFRNPPFGYMKQDFFLNTVIAIKTSMNYNLLLKYILYLEKNLGRKRSFKNAPRTIDIDILFYKNKKINKENLIIPHHDWKNRPSVVVPLSLI